MTFKENKKVRNLIDFIFIILLIMATLYFTYEVMTITLDKYTDLSYSKKEMLNAY